MSLELPAYIEKPIQEKLLKVIDTVCENLPEQPSEVFVSTSSNGIGPNYPSVWLFTRNLLVEIRHPLNQDRIQFELFPFRDAVDWMRLNARKYDFKKLTKDAELDLEFTTKDGLTGELSATGDACAHLMKIYKGRFSVNFTGTQ